jgi:hypothetical protein
VTTCDEAVTRWEARQAELSQLHAQVDGAALVGQFLLDLEALTKDEPPVSLTTASERSGYSTGHLARLVKSGRLKDYGRKHAPRVRISECPRKATLAVGGGRPYNADTDARSLVGSRR